MLFTPMTQIMAASVQRQQYAGVRLDGPTTGFKARRHGFFHRAHTGSTPTFATRRSPATA